jgi:hypothetical protein
VTRSILSAVLVAAVGVVVLFLVNLGVTRIPPEHYRQVVERAVQDGTMDETIRQAFTPDRRIHLVGGSECMILGMLVTPRETPVRASISPRVPVVVEHVDVPAAPGFGPAEVCRILGRYMASLAGAHVPFVHVANHHRYLHAPLTLAALMLALVSLHAAEWLLLLTCYAAVAVLGLAAAVRMRAPDASERRRALAFLILAGVFGAFYGLPVFGRSFAHAPTDVALIAFCLVGLLTPLCELPERRFAVVVAAFGSAIAVLELLTGGIPTALALLIALIALGNAPDARILWRRLAVGVACFCVAIATCFALKFVAIALAWGPDEVAPLVGMLGARMTGNIGSWPALEQWVTRLGFDTGAINDSVVFRRLLGVAFVTYSAFILAWGSHLLGAALVIVPPPLLLALTLVALRRVPRDQWLAQPQPLLLAAAAVPFAWYLAFPWHTTTHSLFMVRLVTPNVALAAIALVLLPGRGPRYRTARAGTMTRAPAAPDS